MERFSVRISGGAIRFSAAHFLVFGTSECEHLHGHNYRVSACLGGPLNETGYVYDFLAVKRMLRTIVGEIDHRTILPGQSPLLRIEVAEDGIRAVLGSRVWILPREDCAVLPIASSTAEEMARWIAGGLEKEITRSGLPRPERLAVEVEEDEGQAAIYESAVDDEAPRI